MKAEKNYIADISCNDEWVNSPQVAQFTMSEADAREVVRLAQLVKKHGLFRVERFDYRVSYLMEDPEDCDEELLEDGEPEEARVDCDCISVSSTEFWFTANEKHTNIEYTVERQSIKVLADHFGIDFSA